MVCHPMIHVTHLSKTYQTPIRSGNPIRDLFHRQYEEHPAVRDLSCTIETGELVGFIGPNGAGKTTTLKMLSGILMPSGGSIEVNGHRPFAKEHSFLRSIGFIMGQRNQLIWDLPALDTYQVNKAIYEVPDQQYRQTIKDLTEMLDCQKLIHQPVKTLSLGQRMRLEFIAALVHRPQVLFLDEPTIGLDIFAQATIRRFIRDYQQQYQATILLTSHYMQDVHHLAQRVMVINEGTIIYDGTLPDLIDTYTAKKTIVLTLTNELLQIPPAIQALDHQYRFPQLTITVEKDRLQHVIGTILESIEYRDLSIESQSLEEIIAMLINGSQKTA